MSVIRVEKNKNYTCMSNYHLRDKNLSLKAKGLMSVILSLPDNWKYSMAGLVAICKEGESSVKAAFKELEKDGFVTVSKLYPNQTKSGRIEYVYTIHEEPIKQESCIQGVENLGVVSQDVENQGQLNTEEPSTDKPNTKDKTKKEDKEELPYAEIIGYLNEKRGKNFRHTTVDYRREIHARWVDEGKPDIAEFVKKCKYVIDVKCADWLGTDLENNLNPKTLFRAANFDRYVNQSMPRKTRKPQRQMDLSEYGQPKPGDQRYDSETGVTEVYQQDGTWMACEPPTDGGECEDIDY